MQNYLLYYNGKSNEMLRNSFIIHRVKFIMQEFFQTHSYLSQIFGFLAIAVGILMYQFKKHKTIMILMALNAALWCLHYGSLWLFTPVAMNFINLARSYVCSFDNKFACSKAVPVVFIVLSLALTVVTWQGAWDILILVSSVFATVGGWQKNPQILRVSNVLVCLCWLPYNFVNNSWAGIVNNLLTLVSLIVALIRYRAKQKQPN